MGKKKKAAPIPEEVLHLPPHESLKSGKSAASIVDTHTHLLSTFAVYQKAYPDGFQSYHEFVRGFYRPPATSAQEAADTSENQDARQCKHSVDTLIDVWCEAPVDPRWKAVADSARDEEQRKSLWGGIDYWFVMGVHPHEARLYTDDVERDIKEAMMHPRCIGWGEIGLDYHYMNSPADVQRTVLRRQLQQAVALGKPITVHTREADEDIEAILKEEVPKEHKIHVHCFTDSPELARRLLSHFSNLCIGITGVITYSTNLNTAQVVREMTRGNEPFSASQLRIVLETDAPYMVPANLYDSLALPGGKSNRLALSHSGMIPWTAGFVADVVNESEENRVDANDILEISRSNARLIYGI
ncbi:Metallo-dependent hydrolase [Serendipita vermifera]|nr:Metallo-dependent hydrolase [Serendipita vermifera]